MEKRLTLVWKNSRLWLDRQGGGRYPLRSQKRQKSLIFVEKLKWQFPSDGTRTPDQASAEPIMLRNRDKSPVAPSAVTSFRRIMFAANVDITWVETLFK
jgi:hypothetical protein